MTKKEKLKKLRNKLSNLFFEEIEEEEIDEYEVMSDDKLELDDLNCDHDAYSNAKDFFGLQALATELIFLYAKYDKILDGTLLRNDLNTTLFASILVMSGLSFHIISDFLVDKTNDKINKLELKIKANNKIEDFYEQ